MQPLWAASGVTNGDNHAAGVFRFVPVGCCDVVLMSGINGQKSTLYGT
jgi:hypothetical protein